VLLALGFDSFGALVVSNTQLRITAQNSILPLSLYDLLWEIFTFTKPAVFLYIEMGGSILVCRQQNTWYRNLREFTIRLVDYSLIPFMNLVKSWIMFTHVQNTCKVLINTINLTRILFIVVYLVFFRAARLPVNNES
jgi:hypothetical protein